MIVYIKDRVTNEVIAVTYDVHREAKHFISYSAEIDQSIVTLNKNLIAVAMDSGNKAYEINHLEYKNQLEQWKHDIENSKNSCN